MLTPEIADKFVRSERKIPNISAADSAIWVRFAVDAPPSFDDGLYLEIAYSYFDRIELYFQTNDGAYLSKITTYQMPFSSRAILHRYFVYDLGSQPGTRQFYYLRIMSEVSIQLPLTLWTHRSFLEKNNTEQLLLGILFGMMIVMVFYNFFIFLSLKDKVYLYFVLFLASYVIFQLIYTGLAFQYLWPRHPIIAAFSIFFFDPLSNVFLLLYLMKFLDAKIKMPLLSKLLFAIIVLQLVEPIIAIVSAHAASYYLFYQGIFVVVLFLSASLIALLKGMRIARVLLVAWIFPLLATLLEILSEINLLPRSPLSYYYSAIASALLVVLLYIRA